VLVKAFCYLLFVLLSAISWLAWGFGLEVSFGVLPLAAADCVAFHHVKERGKSWWH
jgi:hypothetical protein